MSTTTKKLEELLIYYLATRTVGYTTLMRQGLDNYQDEKFVLATNTQRAHDFDLKNSKDIIS